MSFVDELIVVFGIGVISSVFHWDPGIGVMVMFLIFILHELKDKRV